MRESERRSAEGRVGEGRKNKGRGVDRSREGVRFGDFVERMIGYGPFLAALLGAVAVLATLPPEHGGPGITCDEPYHMAYGKYLILKVRDQGLAFFSPDHLRQTFAWRPDGPPVHPPLAHWVLGGAHNLFDPGPYDPSVITIVGARFATALAFGLLVWMVGAWVASAAGSPAGTAAAAAVVLTPRMFGHAHFAALDLFTALATTASILAVVTADVRGGRWPRFALAGAVWGLALLTRFHGLLLLPPIVGWLIWRYRTRAIGPAAAWASAGLATFFVGWPWLWLDPIGHLRQFITASTVRQPIDVFYLGQVWPDHGVPWHYAPVLFAVTMPVGFLLLGLIGARNVIRPWAPSLFSGARKPEAEASTEKPDPYAAGWLLLLGSFVFWLLVFMGPQTPVYDGERLFLPIYPLWAAMVGLGAKRLVEGLGRFIASPRGRVVAVAVLIGLQGVGLVIYSPCYLSHYNLLVGGLWGAERLGFEVTYWGDAVGEDVLAVAAEQSPDAAIAFQPELAPYYIAAAGIGSPGMAENRTRIMPWNAPGEDRPRHIAVWFNRKANRSDVPVEVRRGRVVSELRIQGVWLARVVEFTRAPAARP